MEGLHTKNAWTETPAYFSQRFASPTSTLHALSSFSTGRFCLSISKNRSSVFALVTTIIALRKQEPLSVGEGAPNFSTISTSGPSVAVRGGAQLGVLATSSMSLFFPRARSELGSPSVAVHENDKSSLTEGSSLGGWRFSSLDIVARTPSTGA